MAFRTLHIGRKTGILLVLAVALAMLVAAWDWNWFRKPVLAYFKERSGRDVQVDDLHISFNEKLEPTVRMRGVRIPNAAWADPVPFITAREVAFTFALRSITERRPVVSHLKLVDAEVDLERQADGHRNWRLRNPENTARGRMKVVHLEARNSRIRFIRRDTGFEIVANSSVLQPASSNSGGPLTMRIRFEGQFKGQSFSGDTETGDVLSIMESGMLFPVRGHMQAGKTRFDADGALANLFRPSAMEGRLRLQGASLAGLHPFVPGKLPDSRPYDVQAQVHQDGERMSASELRAKIGQTQLAGEFSLDRSGERPRLEAKLRSALADFADIGSLAGLEGGRQEATQAQDGGVDRHRLFPRKPIPFEQLEALDARISLNLAKIRHARWRALESFQADAELQEGVLSLKPVVGLAEGRIAGTIRIDGTSRPAALAVKLDGRDIRVEKLLSGYKLQGTAAGPLGADVDLKARGDSVAQLLGSATGSAKAHLDHGVVSELANAVIELDLGKVMKELITRNNALAINRIDIEFDFRDGKGAARNLFIDTERTRVVGTGAVDLDREALDLTFVPHPKKQRVLPMGSAVAVQGPISRPHVKIVRKGVTRDE
jgi:uncharacterized protein involved in outer membrane biogenesis